VAIVTNSSHDSKHIELVILGAGGHARELYGYIEDLRRHGQRVELRGFIDDGLAAGVYGKLNVLGSTREFRKHFSPARERVHYITAFGSNELRRRVVRQIDELFGPDIQPWTLIHPDARIGEDVTLGAGCCLAPGAVVTSSIAIGAHCILNVKASVSHDSTLGDFVNINPGATVCGTVTIGEGAFIGTGAVVKDRINIGEWSLIGAGAAVVHDIPSYVVAAGVPARIIRHLPKPE
jgi:sugar O-acyltransferase (sialic acid O-acetyltransferase NeuD family)